MATDPGKKKVAIKRPKYTPLNPKTSAEQNRFKAQNNLTEAINFKKSLTPGQQSTRHVYDLKSGSQNSRSVSPKEVAKADSVISASRVYLRPKKTPKK